MQSSQQEAYDEFIEWILESREMETLEEYLERKEVERLDERYNSWRSDLRKVTNKIIVDWINQMEENIYFDGNLVSFLEDEHYLNPLDKEKMREVEEFEKRIKKSQKLHDKLLRYIIANENGKINSNIEISSFLRGKKIIILFDWYGYDNPGRFGYACLSGQEKRPFVNLFYNNVEITFHEILNSIKNGTGNCYNTIEKYLSRIQKALYHELTHISQILRGENPRKSNILPYENLLGTLSDFIYFTEDAEMDAMFNEVYVTYKRRGKYEANAKNSRKTKNRNFMNLLLDELFEIRFGENIRERWKNYKLGKISWGEFFNKLYPFYKLLFYWSVFVYGLNSDFRDLILRDDKTSLRDNLNLNVIKQNTDNIKNTFDPILKDNNLLTHFCAVMNKNANLSEFYDDIFSVTKNNTNWCRKISNWMKD